MERRRRLHAARRLPLFALPILALATLALATLALAALGLVATAAQAHGRFHGGVHFGFAPPVHAPPYAYHPHHAPAPYPVPPVAGEGCYAGAYVCPLDGPARVGMPCACPTRQGPAWGRAR